MSHQHSGLRSVRCVCCVVLCCVVLCCGVVWCFFGSGVLVNAREKPQHAGGKHEHYLMAVTIASPSALPGGGQRSCQPRPNSLASGTTLCAGSDTSGGASLDVRWSLLGGSPAGDLRNAPRSLVAEPCGVAIRTGRTAHEGEERRALQALSERMRGLGPRLQCFGLWCLKLGQTLGWSAALPCSVFLVSGLEGTLAMGLALPFLLFT